jgi:hypothetical protein
MSRKLRYGLTVVLFLALLGWVVYKVRHNPEWRNFDFSQFQAVLFRLDYRFLLVALFAIYSTYLLRSLRWREFLMPIKMTSITNLFTATVIGFGGLALLGRPGELLRPYLISRKEAMPVTTQMAVWVLERVYDLSMIIVIVGGVMFLSLDAQDVSPGKTRALQYLRTAGLSALVMTLFGILALVLFRRHWHTLVPWMMGRLQFLPGQLVSGIRSICEDFGRGLSSLRSSRAFLMGLVYTTLVWLSISLGYFVTLRAFGPPLSEFSFAAAVTVMGFAIGGSLLQVPAIGGGTQVFTIIALTEVFDVRPEAATSAALVLWLLTFVAVVPPALIFLFREGLSLRKLRLLTVSE